ncbi:glycosyltransferase family 39 protein [Candidatus Woesearchaeota archaeon]|nr:glycosyltransferase family 39 protein [Candidatus Woesearchaeota archaeon]
MLKNRQSYALLLIFAIVFVSITFKGLKTEQPGDENVYYYMGKLASEGKVPYRDFFYAHPPLQIYLIALIYKAFGFNIVALKLAPLISTMITAFFVFKIAQKFGNAEAIAAFFIFLFSYSTMFNSVFSFGIELAAMFLAIGAYFLFSKDSYWAAGLFFGLAGATRLLSLIPISVLLIYVLLLNRKNFFKLSSGFLAVFLAVNGISFLIAGKAYLADAYLYHLQKSSGGAENLKEYSDIVKLNWILFLSFFLFIFSRDRRMHPFALAAAAYLAFLLMLKKLFGFYFIVAFPFLAVIGGFSIVSLAGKAELPKKWKVAIFLTICLVFGWNLFADASFLGKMGFTGFERGRDMADFIISSADNETLLFGDDSIAPLLALATGKRIALDFVDTNDQVFSSGAADLGKVLGGLKGKNLLFIARDRQGISSFREAREFLNKNCNFLANFHGKTEGNYLIYRCS